MDKPVYRKIVLYSPNNQNTGIEIVIDVIDAKKFRSFKRIKFSNLRQKANHVHKIHKAISFIIAIILLEYLFVDKIFFENSLK